MGYNVAITDRLAYSVTLTDRLSYSILITDRLPYALTITDRLPYSLTITDRLAYSLTVEDYNLPMPSYVVNFTSFTGLTGGTATDLDGLSATVLNLYVDGTVAEMYLTGNIALKFRLRAIGTDTESAPWIIACDNDATRVWQLLAVTKEGLACTYNSATGLWYRVWSVGSDGSATVSQDETGFSIPA
tara:strand:+ start:4423 stop:4983 length:561 start_codon:yes stop_codon:yes gene_type:complete